MNPSEGGTNVTTSATVPTAQPPTGAGKVSQSTLPTVGEDKKASGGLSQEKIAETKEKLQKPSGLSRVFNPPKLERKHSSGDLISRLKTRKILGVGETDNGDIHRSKISQVLGHNEHLYVRLPKGFWITHMMVGICVTIEALLLLLSPTLAASFGFLPPFVAAEEEPSQAIRVAGAALCGLSVFVWSLLGTTDKHYARTVLLSVLTYQAISAALSTGSAIYQGGLGERWVRASVGLRAVLCLVCLAYFHRIASFVPIRGNRAAFTNRQSAHGTKEN